MSSRPALSMHLSSGGIPFLRISPRSVLVLSILVAGSVGAAELLPYEPPRVSNRTFQGGAVDKGNSFNQFESVDRNFISDTKRLSVQEKAKLATDLLSLQKKAINEGQWDAAKYYDRLLSLLNAKRL